MIDGLLKTFSTRLICVRRMYVQMSCECLLTCICIKLMIILIIVIIKVTFGIYKDAIRIV